MKVTIYRKPTHTDQYLNFDSNHPLQHKRGVVRTLLHRADHVVTEEEDKEKEKEHVRQALAKCGYPRWMLNTEAKPTTEDVPPKERTESTKKCFPQTREYAEAASVCSQRSCKEGGYDRGGVPDQL